MSNPSFSTYTMRYITLLLSIVCIGVLCTLLLSCKHVEETYSEISDPYSFFVAGHTYAWRGLNKGFVDKFGYIQDRPEIQFGIFTGDMVASNPTASNWDLVDRDVKNLGLTAFFSAGNHDIENRTLFEERYGDTYYSFFFEHDLFIVLDPNIDHWNISDEQLEFLVGVLKEYAIKSRHIFVFFHQLIWWEPDTKYAQVIPNSMAGRAESINFWTEVEPLFHDLSNKVYMFAGDVGAGEWSSDFMFDQYDNITLIASGMGEGVGDNFLIINVDSRENVGFDLICLNNQVSDCLREIENLNMSTLSAQERQSEKTVRMPLYDISSGGNMENSWITVYSLAGEKLKFGSVNEGLGSLISILGSGVYIYVVEDEVMDQTGRFVVI